MDILYRTMMSRETVAQNLKNKEEKKNSYPDKKVETKKVSMITEEIEMKAEAMEMKMFEDLAKERGWN